MPLFASNGSHDQSVPHSPQYLLPADSFDTHVHVFDPRLGPYAPNRAYTPGDAPLSALIKFEKSISSNELPANIVLVQPSPYKTDNLVLKKCLEELRKQDQKPFGIAVLDFEHISDHELKELHNLGVRGIRLNLVSDGEKLNLPLLQSILQESANRIKDLPGWMIQVFVPGQVWECLYGTILNLPVPVIADHLGGMRGSSKLPSELGGESLAQPGLEALLSLAKKSKVIVKISGLYRMSTETDSIYEDLKPIIQEFRKEIPHQVIWGSDWPHTGEAKERAANSLDNKESFRQVDNIGVLRQLHDWMGEDAWRTMIVDNPRRFFR